MLIAAATVLIAGALLMALYVREKDLLPATAPSPAQHLEERKAQIYENLRDLQFEYRVGKLSDEDYQKTKLELQSELAKVLTQIDGLTGKAVKAAAPATTPAPAAASNVCPHCKATFDRALKFCGECGKPMTGDAA